MSLINDALNRAGEADRRRRSSRPPLSPLQPAPTARPRGGGIRWLGLLLLVCLGAASWWLLYPPFELAPMTPAPILPVPPAAQPDPTPVATVEPAPPIVSESSPSAARIRVSTNLITRPATELIPPVPEPANSLPPEEAVVLSPAPFGVAEAMPAMRLQSIIYRRNQPTAMIDGQTVQAGDLLGEVRVVEIQRQSVTVEWRGQFQVLSLPHP
jgi:hypothetical protein